MHCWKILNIERQYGMRKMYAIAIIHGVLAFSFSYALLNLFNHEIYNDHYFWAFCIALVFIYPLHKLLHFLPLYRYRHQISFRIRRKLFGIRTIHMRVREPIQKNLYIFSLLCPFFIINTALLLIAIFLPTITHFATILIGVHSLLCAFDYIYVKHLLISPANAMIEETPRGYEILVPL